MNALGRGFDEKVFALSITSLKYDGGVVYRLINAFGIIR